MVDIVLERRFDPGIGLGEVQQMATGAADCCRLHRVVWRMSHLAVDGRRMVCWFSAPDAESVRLALRSVDADTRVVWPASVHDSAEAEAASLEPNVLVERRFAAPSDIGDIQAIEDAGAWCLDAYGVRFVRTFFSRDRRRMLCLYHAPDAEAVRLAQRQAGMPVERAWACRVLK